MLYKRRIKPNYSEFVRKPEIRYSQLLGESTYGR